MGTYRVTARALSAAQRAASSQTDDARSPAGLDAAHMGTAHARDVLPVPDIPAPGLVTYDAKDPDTSFAPIEELRPPAGAPNVLIVLIDDAGFGSASAFGGPCATPNAERLAAGGPRDNPFPTTAVCLPAPAPPLHGRNPHTGGKGGEKENPPAGPGPNPSKADNRPPP